MSDRDGSKSPVVMLTTPSSYSEAARPRRAEIAALDPREPMQTSASLLARLRLDGAAADDGAEFARRYGRTARAEEALVAYNRSTRALDSVPARIPSHAPARSYLANDHWGRADALVGLGRHAEALEAWDRAIPLAAGAQPVDLRLGRAGILARAGGRARRRRLRRGHPRRARDLAQEGDRRLAPADRAVAVLAAAPYSNRPSPR